jgi:hypothetical protein
VIAVVSASKFEEILNTCGATEQKTHIVTSNETVANFGDFSIIFSGFQDEY